MKRCSKCGTFKSLSSFHRKAKQKTGLNPQCKDCVRGSSRQYYLRNQEKVKSKTRKYALENPELIKEDARRRYQKNKEFYKTRAQKWADENRERRRAICRSFEKRARQNNPELYRQKQRRSDAIRRARIAKAGGTITPEWWRLLFDVFETGVCVYCGATDRPLTMDHWIPVSRGGPTEVGNLIPCCGSCNSRKGNKSPDEWQSKIGHREGRGISIQQFLDLTRSCCDEQQAQYGIDVEIVK